MSKLFVSCLLAALLASPVLAQQNSGWSLYPANPHPAPVPDNLQDTAPTQDQMPVYRVNVYARTAKAVNYRNRGGSTTVLFKGTDLMPQVSGEAKVDGKAGRLDISADLNHIQPARSLGGQYLTYVLWAITPEGRTVNLGEMVLGGNGKSKINVTTDLQAFGLIVTAEPYFAVTHPSSEVVAENVIQNTTKGFEEPIDAKFDVLEGRQYTIDVPASELPAAQANPKVPLDLLEARDAVAIAKAAGAQQYAPDSLTKAEDMLQRAENYYERKQGVTPIGTAARGATEMAEDARVLTLRKKEQEKEEAQRRATEQAEQQAREQAQQAQQQAAQAQSQADQEAQRRAQAEQAKAQAELAQAQARLQQEQAEQQAQAAQQAAEDAERQKEAAIEQAHEAEMQREAALQQTQQAQQQAQEAEQEKQHVLAQQQQMRARLMAQLNQVLQTKDTAKGLIVSMPDVLFGFNKYDLRPEARERLAKVSGILLAYPDLKLHVEGYTDNIGSDRYNQELSEKRAQSVRDYLVNSGVPMNNVVAEGFGKSDPIASNDSATGRKLNRRVEIVVSGNAIGQAIAPGDTTGQSGTENTPSNTPAATPGITPLPQNGQPTGPPMQQGEPEPEMPQPPQR